MGPVLATSPCWSPSELLGCGRLSGQRVGCRAPPACRSLFLEGPAGGGGRTTDGAGRRGRRTLECPGAVEGGCGGRGTLGHRSTGRDGFSPLGLFQVWIGNLVWGKLDPCWRTAILNPRELTSFFGALSPPWHVGAFPSPAKDFKRQSHDRARGSTCSSQVQGQSARIQSWLGDSKSRSEERR